ncbi:MAG: ATP-binding protein [Rhodocyclaceae bacterium]|nr:ATP-binding protein [Rhodocyclaceae bacterium]
MPVDPRLRAAAEARLPRAAAGAVPARPAEEVLHELQVHQIELEMQNETLRQTQIALEESRDRYVDLYEFAPVGYLTLSAEGLIAQINLTGATLLGMDRRKLPQRRFDAFVARADRDRWNQLFVGALHSEARAQIELALQRHDGEVWQAHVDCLRVAAAAPLLRVTLADITARTRLERELAASYQRVKDLSRRMVDLQEDARRLLSAELHDRTSPNLAAIKINLDILAALPPEAGEERAARLTDTRALVADTDASIRQIAADLRPPVFDYAGLNAAVAAYARQFAKRTGIAVKVDCAPVQTRLAPAIESLLFRIFQEALTNCAKHAHTGSIAVALNCAARPAILIINDNGIGFDVAAAVGSEHGGGLGLLNMKEMAEFAGGRFAIESQPGRGTRIEVKV